MIHKSHSLLEKFINSRIIYNMLSEEALTQYTNRDDEAIRKALEAFKNNRAFPTKK